MIAVDYHSHSLFSNCGIHTVLEMLSFARSRGLKGLAISDHGPELKGRLNSVFYERLKDPVEGIRLLKGFECNLTSKKGKIDFIMEFLKYTDVVLLGIHRNTPKACGKTVYTDLIVAAMENNPYVDIITHLNDPVFPVEFSTVAETAKSMGMAIELNNSKAMLDRVTPGSTEAMLEACIKAECFIALGSDAHVITEIGLDDSIRPVLKRLQFPKELIVNRDAKKGFEFIEARRQIKKKYR